MQADHFTLTIHMVSSLDGKVARKDNSVSWFETADRYEKGSGEPDIKAFLSTIDCYIMGSRTYEHALELSKSYGWAYGDKPTIVVTGRALPVERPNVELYSYDLVSLVDTRLRPKFRNAWLVGGPSLAREFMRLGLADDIRLSVLPIILGDGLPFFETTAQEQALHLKDVTAYRSGVVELWYEIIKQRPGDPVP